MAQNVVQRIWGVFDPVSGALKGVTTSGEYPYYPILGSATSASTISGVNGVRSTPKASTTMIFANSYATIGDGGGGIYVLNPADTTSGATAVGSCSGTSLTLTSVTSGTVAIGQVVSRGDTGAAIGTITAGAGLSWTLSAPGATVPGPVVFAFDNGVTPLVGFDSGRWYLMGTNGAPFPTNTAMLNGPPMVDGAQVGTALLPTGIALPLVHYAKYINVTTGIGNGYDGGAIWGSVYVMGGPAYGKAVTGYLEIDAQQSPFIAGDASVAVHAFTHIIASVYGANGLCGWDTAHDDNPGITVTGASGTGTTVTLTFAALSQAPPVGGTINVSGINPAGYNGNFVTTATSTTSVSYANATVSAYVAGGLILTNQIFGREIDLVMQAPRVRSGSVLGWASGVGLWINNQSNVNGPYHGVAAIGVTQSGVGAAASQWWTCFWNATNSVVPASSGASEIMQMNGGSIAANAYGGLRLQSFFNVGIDMSGAQFTGTSACILLPNSSTSGGNIQMLDSSGTPSYQVLALDNNAPNRLIIGAGVPGNIQLIGAGVQVTKTLAVGTAPGANVNIVSRSNATLTGTGQVGIQVADTFSSAATSSAQGITIANQTQAAAFNIPNYFGIGISNLSLGAGSSVTNQVGINVADLTSGGTKNIGIQLQVTSGAGKFSIVTGTAPSQFNGSIGVNGVSPYSQVTGWGTPTGAGVFANFPAATATLAQTAQAVAQLITDLKGIGFYGA